MPSECGGKSTLQTPKLLKNARAPLCVSHVVVFNVEKSQMEAKKGRENEMRRNKHVLNEPFGHLAFLRALLSAFRKSAKSGLENALLTLFTLNSPAPFNGPVCETARLHSRAVTSKQGLSQRPSRSRQHIDQMCLCHSKKSFAVLLLAGNRIECMRLCVFVCVCVCVCVCVEKRSSKHVAAL